MNYTKKYINSLSAKYGFVKVNIEKVIKLISVLSFIYQNEYLKDAFVLKGGTAINLIYINMRQLSVDIDLDYVKEIDKEKTL